MAPRHQRLVELLRRLGVSPPVAADLTSSETCWYRGRLEPELFLNVMFMSRM